MAACRTWERLGNEVEKPRSTGKLGGNQYIRTPAGREKFLPDSGRLRVTSESIAAAPEPGPAERGSGRTPGRPQTPVRVDLG